MKRISICGMAGQAAISSASNQQPKSDSATKTARAQECIVPTYIRTYISVEHSPPTQQPNPTSLLRSNLTSWCRRTSFRRNAMTTTNPEGENEDIHLLAILPSTHHHPLGALTRGDHPRPWRQPSFDVFTPDLHMRRFSEGGRAEPAEAGSTRSRPGRVRMRRKVVQQTSPAIDVCSGRPLVLVE